MQGAYLRSMGMRSLCLWPLELATLDADAKPRPVLVGLP